MSFTGGRAPQYSRIPDTNYGLPSRSRVSAPGYPEMPSYERRPSPRPAKSFGVVACPSDALALRNSLIVHPSDFPKGQHVLVNDRFPVTTLHDDTGKVRPGTLGASALQRQWMGLSQAGDQVIAEPLPLPPHPKAPLFLQHLELEVGFLRPKQEATEIFSADEMTHTFVEMFDGIIFSAGQSFAFQFRRQILRTLVKSANVVELAQEQRRGASSEVTSATQQSMGTLMKKTDVTFMKAPDSAIKIKSSSKKAPPNAILAPNFRFEDMGIGGLDNEFNQIFRRAFASRVFPPGLVEKLGIQHIKGILLYGPPGTGKTLIARQIGKMLNAREPKIVNGPEVLNKYVGQSEENIRKLFGDAEKEYKERGDESGLHIIIFDELDAIFKQRGSANSASNVGDSVVNQLLSKMDGVDQLNNILIIGMTNRIDMIDEALLRPGRLEVHMEISLPDENGRLQILKIHTSKMRTNGVMDNDVDLEELAFVSKNFSGAEIAGLIKSATSFAFNRHVKVGTMAGISDDVENLKVNRSDFIRALDDVHPAFGVSEEELQTVIQNGIIRYHTVVDELLRVGQLFVEQVRSSTRTPLVSILLHGPLGSGKTALAATIAQQSQFPFIKLVSPDTMVGFTEQQKAAAVNKVFMDSYKSPLSVIVVDNLERLLDWAPIGPRFSNLVLQTLLVLFAKRPPKGRRLLVIATSSLKSVLSELGLVDNFDSELRVPPIASLSAIDFVLREVELFRTDEERQAIITELENVGFPTLDEGEGERPLQIGIKKLLTVVEMARQEPMNVGERLVSALMGLGM